MRSALNPASVEPVVALLLPDDLQRLGELGLGQLGHACADVLAVVDGSDPRPVGRDLALRGQRAINRSWFS